MRTETKAKLLCRSGDEGPLAGALRLLAQTEEAVSVERVFILVEALDNCRRGDDRRLRKNRAIRKDDVILQTAVVDNYVCL